MTNPGSSAAHYEGFDFFDKRPSAEKISIAQKIKAMYDKKVDNCKFQFANTGQCVNRQCNACDVSFVHHACTPYSTIGSATMCGSLHQACLHAILYEVGSATRCVSLRPCIQHACTQYAMRLEQGSDGVQKDWFHVSFSICEVRTDMVRMHAVASGPSDSQL